MNNERKEFNEVFLVCYCKTCFWNDVLIVFAEFKKSQKGCDSI